jgi:FAD/FMN-containing dehydrogenase
MSDEAGQAASPGDGDPVLAGLRDAVGARHVLTGEADVAPYLVEWRGLFHGRARAVVRPSSTQEVSAVLRLCHAAGVPVVPQGGNTGLVGGQTPDASGAAIVLSLQRMNRIREVDPSSDSMTVEAGVTLLAAQEAAEAAGRFFPLSLASEGSCTIGGNLGTNAGGTAVLAYGNARELVLGLEVVLADGRVWNGLGKLRKDNTGYDLRHLFIGSEGTLGVITAAVLKLFPQRRAIVTAFVGLPSPAAALALLDRAKAAFGSGVTTFELMPRLAVEMVVRHIPGNRDPLASPSPWNVLLELSSPSDATLAERAEALLAAAAEAGDIEDAVIAASLEQREALWRLRESLPEAQGHEGGSIKHDISLPLSRVPAFIATMDEALGRLVPGCRPLPFGHLGDGNLHFNVTQPAGADKAAFLALWDAVNEVVLGAAVREGGSISAEHGIGQLKRRLLQEVKDPVALALMRSIKDALDPRGILNPGKVL